MISMITPFPSQIESYQPHYPAALVEYGNLSPMGYHSVTLLQGGPYSSRSTPSCYGSVWIVTLNNN